MADVKPSANMPATDRFILRIHADGNYYGIGDPLSFALLIIGVIRLAVECWKLRTPDQVEAMAHKPSWLFKKAAIFKIRRLSRKSGKSISRDEAEHLFDRIFFCLSLTPRTDIHAIIQEVQQ